jgi:hypothetical protein
VAPAKGPDIAGAGFTRAQFRSPTQESTTMRTALRAAAVVATFFGATSSLAAQAALPATQPNRLVIFREFVKPGHNADHEKLEVGWPAAYAKAKSTAYYLALTSMTGANEAWYISNYESWKALGDQNKSDAGNASLTTELDRLSKADGEHLTNTISIHAIGRPDLSHGAFPEMAKQRVFEISWYRVRLGHEAAFEAAVKVVQKAFAKALPQSSYRIYQVVGGVVNPAFLVFSSGASYEVFDAGMAMDAALNAAYSPEDRAMLQKFALEGLLNVETQRFAMNGPMSYVAAETIAQDPGFWRPKKPAVKPQP